MATAASLTAELHDAGVPTHRSEIKALIARKAFESVGYDLKAYIRALPVTEQLDLVDFLAHQLSWSYGADQIGRGADFTRDELAEEAANAADRGRP